MLFLCANLAFAAAALSGGNSPTLLFPWSVDLRLPAVDAKLAFLCSPDARGVSPFMTLDAMFTIEGRGEVIVFRRSFIRLTAEDGSASEDGKSGCKAESILARCPSVGRGVSGGKGGSEGMSETELLSISRRALLVASESATCERLIAGSAAAGVMSLVSFGESTVHISMAVPLRAMFPLRDGGAGALIFDGCLVFE